MTHEPPGALVARVLAQLPVEAVPLVKRYLGIAGDTDDARPIDTDSAEWLRIVRMLKHPLRARRLRGVKETSYAPLGDLLQLVFGQAFRRCRKCDTVYEATAEFFGHQPNGDLRHSCKRCQAENTRRWATSNPERVRERLERRKLAMEAAGPEPTGFEMVRLRVQQGDACYYCGEPLNGGGELDHKVSVQRGGVNAIENRAWACRTCNRDKVDKTVEEFLRWRREHDLPVSEGIPEDKRTAE